MITNVKTQVLKKIKDHKHCSITVVLSKSMRKNSKNIQKSIHYINRNFQHEETKLKKHITHDDLISLLDFICCNKKEYPKISIYFNDAINTYSIDISNRNMFSSIECFINYFIQLASMLDNLHDNMPHWFKLDHSGDIEHDIKYMINKCYNYTKE